MRGSRMIRIAHLHKTTLDATIGTLFLFSIGAPIRTMTHTLLFKMGGIGGGARNGQNWYSGSLKRFQLNLRLRNNFLSGPTGIAKAPGKFRNRHKPSAKRWQARVKNGEDAFHPPGCIEQTAKIPTSTHCVPSLCEREVQTGQRRPGIRGRGKLLNHII